MLLKNRFQYHSKVWGEKVNSVIKLCQDGKRTLIQYEKWPEFFSACLHNRNSWCYEFRFCQNCGIHQGKKKAHEPFMWINVCSKLRGRLVRETALGICLSPAEILNLCEVVLSKIALYCDCLEFGDTEVVLFWMLTIFVSFYLYCIYLDAIFRFFFPWAFYGKGSPCSPAE